MYKSYDKQYNEIVQTILNNGIMDNHSSVRTVYADGTLAPTKAIINAQIKLDNSKYIPILTTKRVPLKDPVKELLWIWQMMSNDVRDLQKLGCSVWNEWMQEDKTIGKAYGWQLRNKKQPVEIDDLLIDMYFNGEFSFGVYEVDRQEGIEAMKQKVLNDEEYVSIVELNQVDYLLYMLKKNPTSRRHKTTLWSIEDLDDMALQPCVYETHWQVFDGKLCLTVNVRSNDMVLGNPYNVYQYAILHRLIAQVSDLEPGELCFNIDNAHLYNRHLELIEQQIKGEIHEIPTIWINPDVKSFYNFTLDDIKVENYKHNGSFSYEIAI